MKLPTEASTPEEFIARLEEPRRTDIARLHAIIRETVPELEPVVASGELGYGPFHYRYASGREGDAFKLAIANRKSGITLDALAADARGWVAERYKDKLPKANVGKGCVRFKRLDDLDLEVLKALLRETAKTPYGTA